MAKAVGDRKVCNACHETLGLDGFHKNRAMPDGMHSQCKNCVNSQRRKRKKTDGSSERWWSKNRHYVTAKTLGLDLAEARALREAHGDSCQICGEKPKRLCLDHDHETNTVRGFLCSHCNWMLGHAKDDPERLLAAARYLQR